MRTTLLQRLKPKFTNGLNGSRDKYEFMVNILEGELSDKKFYNTLSIDIIKSIWLFSNVDGRYDRSNNDWSYGEDMFEIEDDVC
jgi:hypothetical protein